jgi:hypothetical protein
MAIYYQQTVLSSCFPLGEAIEHLLKLAKPCVIVRQCVQQASKVKIYPLTLLA